MLKIENISKTYANGIQALKDVSLEIPRGMYGLLGPNGAGKSTLMRTVATLQEPDAGSITLNGIDVLRQKDSVRRVLGYLPQEFGIYPRVTAEDMLDHLAVLKGITDTRQRRDEVSAILRLTNLHQVRKQRLGTFSGGMRQRFGVAQALLGRPELIIVDEPTAGLDPEERSRFLNILSEIGENVVVILSTHIVEDVSELCSRMAIISQGRVLLTGSPREIVDELQGRVWRREIERSALASYRERLLVISTRLTAGRTVIHVLSPDRPEEGFIPVNADLKDVYFSALLEAQAEAA